MAFLLSAEHINMKSPKNNLKQFFFLVVRTSFAHFQFKFLIVQRIIITLRTTVQHQGTL